MSEPTQATAADVRPCDWLESGEQVLWTQTGKDGKILITTKNRRGVVAVREYAPGEPLPVEAKALTVAELRRVLDGLDDDMLVVLSRDLEGNGYGAAVGTGVYGPAVRGYSPGSPNTVRSPAFGWPALVMYPLPNV